MGTVEAAPTEEAPAEEVVAVEETETPVEEAPATEEVPAAEESTDVAVEETPVEETAVEEAAEVPVEETETTAPESMDAEEDAPLEDWTVKELKEECKTLGLADKGKKAELIERIKEARAATTVPVLEEEVTQTEEAVPVEEVTEVEEATPVAETVAVEEEAPVEESVPAEVTSVEEAAPVEEEATNNAETSSVTLDPSSISELVAKNEQGLLSQQEFFKIFLISVRNSLTTNQRLSAVEKKLEEAESRLEKWRLSVTQSQLLQLNLKSRLKK